MRTMRSGSQWITIGLLGSMIVLSAGGCVRGYQQKMARYEFGPEPVREVIRTPGAYKVKWTRESSKDLHGLDETSIFLAPGDVVGFEPLEDGRIIAFAKDRQFLVDAIPSSAKYFVWYSKIEGETQFGKEVRKAGRTAAQVAGGSALVVGASAAIVGLAVLDAEEDCRNDTTRSWNK